MKKGYVIAFLLIFLIAIPLASAIEPVIVGNANTILLNVNSTTNVSEWWGIYHTPSDIPTLTDAYAHSLATSGTIHGLTWANVVTSVLQTNMIASITNNVLTVTMKNYFNQHLNTTSSPEFAGLTLTSFSGLIKATAGVLGNAISGTDYLAPSDWNATNKTLENQINSANTTASLQMLLNWTGIYNWRNYFNQDLNTTSPAVFSKVNATNEIYVGGFLNSTKEVNSTRFNIVNSIKTNSSIQTNGSCTFIFGGSISNLTIC